MLRQYILSFVLLCLVIAAYTTLVLNTKNEWRSPAAVKKAAAPEAAALK